MLFFVLQTKKNFHRIKLHFARIKKVLKRMYYKCITGKMRKKTRQFPIIPDNYRKNEKKREKTIFSQ